MKVVPTKLGISDDATSMEKPLPGIGFFKKELVWLCFLLYLMS
jgi:hypothetical protein